jgi:hypothetical protein
VADPNRLAVLKALTALLETVVPTAPTIEPALTSMEGLVFRGRNRFGDDDPKTMLSILEAPRPDSSLFTAENQARADDWLLLVQGWCPDDKANPSDAVYFLMDDVENTLDRIIRVSPGTGYPKYPSDYMLGGLITRCQFGPGTVRPPTENISSKSFFYLPVRVGLARISP